MAIQETENMSDGSRIRLDGRGSLNYLGVPVAAKVRFRVADGIRLAGRAGVIPALCVSGHLAGTATAVSQSGQDLASQNFDANSLIGERVLNVFAVVGFGPEFRVTRNQTFRAEATYEQMLLSAAQDSASSMRLRSINVMLSYGFAI